MTSMVVVVVIMKEEKLGQNNTPAFVFESNNLSQSFRGIAISAVAFHIVWDAIFGFIISSLLRIRMYNNNRRHK
jgi:hypothetical protein